jgi:hypothetical protein
MSLLVDEMNRPMAGCPKRAASVVVNVDTLFYVGRVADIEAVVGAAEDIDEAEI